MLKKIQVNAILITYLWLQGNMNIMLELIVEKFALFAIIFVVIIYQQMKMMKKVK